MKVCACLCVYLSIIIPTGLSSFFGVRAQQTIKSTMGVFWAAVCLGGFIESIYMVTLSLLLSRIRIGVGHTSIWNRSWGANQRCGFGAGLHISCFESREYQKK